MAKSQNGWPVAPRELMDENDIYPGVRVPNGVLRGDVAVVLRHVAFLWHTTVEPLVPGTCWGWFVKPIEGSKTISNHASGTAIDLNADQHPMGVQPARNMTGKQISAAHAIEAACDHLVRWGGSYTGRPDPMHWEIIGTPTQIKTLARRITALQEEDVDPNDIKAIAQAVWDGPNAPKLKNAYSDAMQTPGTMLRYVPSRSPHEVTWADLKALNTQIGALNTKLDQVLALLAKP